MQLLCTLVVVAVFSLIDVAPLEPGQAPEFCNGLDCPRFATKNKTDDYEIRCFNETYNWANTIMEDSNSSAAYMRLSRYFGGDNMQKVKLNMTAPVTTQIQSINNGTSFAEKTMNFFIPFKYQRNPPVPSQPNVRIVTAEPFCFHVKVYGGMSSMSKVKQTLDALTEALKRDGLDDYSSEIDFIGTAVYDRTQNLTDRHNEIWYMDHLDHS